jgi:hypothetical protein
VETIQNFGGVPQYLVYMKLDSDDPDALEQAAFYSALYTISMETIGQFPPPSDDPDIDGPSLHQETLEAYESVSEGEVEEEDMESMYSEEEGEDEDSFGESEGELSGSDASDEDGGVEEEEEDENIPPSPAPAG